MYFRFCPVKLATVHGIVIGGPGRRGHPVKTGSAVFQERLDRLGLPVIAGDTGDTVSLSNRHLWETWSQGKDKVVHI